MEGEVPPKWEGAKRLSAWLDEIGLSNTALADSLGLADATISRYASGDRAPDPDTIAILCHTLKISADYLLGLSSSPSGPNAAAEASKVSDSQGAEAMAIEASVDRMGERLEGALLKAILPAIQDVSVRLASLEDLSKHQLHVCASHQPPHTDGAPTPTQASAKAPQPHGARRREAR